MNRQKHVLIIAAILLLNIVRVSAADNFISFTQGDMKLCQTGESFSICISDNDNVAVKLAAKNLASDFQKVCDANVIVSSSSSEARIIAGTIGRVQLLTNSLRTEKSTQRLLMVKLKSIY